MERTQDLRSSCHQWELEIVKASILKTYLLEASLLSRYHKDMLVPMHIQSLQPRLHKDYYNYATIWCKENNQSPVNLSTYLEEIKNIYVFIIQNFEAERISDKPRLNSAVVQRLYQECLTYLDLELIKYGTTKETVKTKLLKNAQQRVELLKQIGFFELDFVKNLERKKREKLICALTQIDTRTIIGILNEEDKYLIKNYDSEQVSDFIKKEL